MSIPEIWHRVCEQLKRAVSRYYLPSGVKNYTSNDSLPVFPILHKVLNSNLQINKHLLDEWSTLANSVKNNDFQFLGIRWPTDLTNQIWHLDPITQDQWPADQYCYHINYRNTDQYGDVKYIWELNRLQYLQPLAILAAINDDKDLSLFCLGQIESWIDANPPYKGINWPSGIELACRIISILVVTTCANNFASEKLKNKIHNSLAIHGYWLMRYPSRFSSANNHLISEASALFILGLLAPNLPNAKTWYSYGKKTLINEATKQIYSDGVGAEQSPTYTAFTVEWLLLCGTIGKDLNDDFPQEYWQRIEKCGEYLRWLTDKQGYQPSIGDNDEGKVFFSQFSAEAYTTSILSGIANTTQREDLNAEISVPHLRELFFGESKPSSEPLQGVKCFAQGGYSVSRTYTNDKEYLLVMDHGPLGYLSIAAHGHADALSIWLHIDGQPILVDAGTYLYHSGGNWRDYMRGTSAHNTLSIDKHNSSQISGSFNWSAKANCNLINDDNQSNRNLIYAQHDGYKKRFNVYHKRKLHLLDNSSFKVTDCLHGDAVTLPVEIGFLFHPQLNLAKNKNSWIVSNNNQAILEITHPNDILQSTIEQGQKKPLEGWYSDAFGYVEPAPRLVFKGNLKTKQEVTINFNPLFK